MALHMLPPTCSMPTAWSVEEDVLMGPGSALGAFAAVAGSRREHRARDAPNQAPWARDPQIASLSCSLYSLSSAHAWQAKTLTNDVQNIREPARETVLHVCGTDPGMLRLHSPAYPLPLSPASPRHVRHCSIPTSVGIVNCSVRPYSVLPGWSWRRRRAQASPSAGAHLFRLSGCGMRGGGMGL
ncbi:hypothetical protein FKP32DRAFT_1287519 [Trametes sanguinea]|nr:hypothetical protein FKP32DRAFT_1287519 [Trametes sanguinea]